MYTTDQQHLHLLLPLQIDSSKKSLISTCMLPRIVVVPKAIFQPDSFDRSWWRYTMVSMDVVKLYRDAYGRKKRAGF